MRVTGKRCTMRVLTACALMAVLAAASAAGPEPARADLEAARQELRLRVHTERRMRQEFESLLAGGRMSAEEITDFESYLARLGALVDAQRHTVAQLGGVVEAPTPVAPLPADFDRGHTDDEKLAKLDAELGESLSEFDDKLLREQKEIAEKSRGSSDDADGDGSERLDGASGDASRDGGQSSSQSSSQGDGESGDASSGAPSEGGEATGADGGPQADSDGRDTGEQAPGEGGREGTEGGNQVASAGGENTGSGRGRASPPPDIPDGADDDIVARQLREAAENEEDPELREKLWEEYRKYKQGTR